MKKIASRKILALLMVLVMVLTIVPTSGLVVAVAGTNGIIATSSEFPNPGIDRLFAGFDVFGGRPLSRSTVATNPIRNLSAGNDSEQTLIDLGIVHVDSWSGGGEVRSSFYHSATMQGLMSEMGISTSSSMSTSVDASARIKGITFKAGATVSFNEHKTRTFSHSSTYESLYTVLRVERRLGRNSIAERELLDRQNRDSLWQSGVWSGSFEYDLVNETNILDLFRRFGSHFIASYHLGGSIESRQTIANISSEEESSITERFGLGLETRLGMSLPAGAGSIDQTFEQEQEFESKQREARSDSNFSHTTDAAVLGGTQDHALAIGAANNGSVNWEEVNSWMNTININDPVNTTDIMVTDQLRLIPIWELLPYEYAERRLQLEQFFNEEAQQTQNTFFNEFIYSTHRPPAANMPTPQFDDSFGIISTEEQLRAVTPGGNYILTYNNFYVLPQRLGEPISMSNLSFTPNRPLTPDDTNITVEWNGFTAQIPISVTALVHAGQPVITGQPQDERVLIDIDSGNDEIRELTVIANAPDAGELSFQWYSNTTREVTGATRINGETNPTFLPRLVIWVRSISLLL